MFTHGASSLQHPKQSDGQRSVETERQKKAATAFVQRTNGRKISGDELATYIFLIYVYKHTRLCSGVCPLVRILATLVMLTIITTSNDA